MDITPWITYFINTAIQAQRIAKRQMGSALSKARYFDLYNAQLSERQRQVLSYMFDVEPGVDTRFVNRSKYVNIAQISPKTAQRDIKDLLYKSALLPLSGGGRSTRYALNMEGLTDTITQIGDAKVQPHQYL